MKKLRFAGRFLLPFILMCVTSNVAWSANKNSIAENFATIESQGNEIYWTINPSIQFQSIKLTLSSSDETVNVTEFDFEPATDPLEDGSYHYELVITPLLSSAVQQEIQTARERADGQKAVDAMRSMKRQGKIPQQKQVQSGYFTIVDGELVIADLVEE